MIFYLNMVALLAETLFCNLLKSSEPGKVNKIKIDRLFIMLSFLQLAVLLCLRAPSVGVDTNTYLSIFREIAHGSRYGYVEPGFRIYMWLISRVSRNSNVFIAMIAIPTLLLNYRFIIKHSKNVYLSVFIYTNLAFYYFQFNGMRQALAQAILLPAIDFAIEKKWIKFIVISLLAVSVHSSAMVILVVFILSFFDIRFRFSFMNFAFMALMSLLAVFLSRGMVAFILNIFGGKYVGYISGGDMASLYNPIMYLIILFIVFTLWRGNPKREDYIMLDMLFIGTMLYFTALVVGYMNRVTYYFNIVVVVLLPNVIHRVEKPSTRSLALLGCYVSVGIYGMLEIILKAQGILPYYFFWER